MNKPGVLHYLLLFLNQHLSERFAIICLLMNLTWNVSVQTSAFTERESEDPKEQVCDSFKHPHLFHSFKAAFYRSSDVIKLIQLAS